MSIYIKPAFLSYFAFSRSWMDLLVCFSFVEFSETSSWSNRLYSLFTVFFCFFLKSGKPGTKFWKIRISFAMENKVIFSTPDVDGGSRGCQVKLKFVFWRHLCFFIFGTIRSQIMLLRWNSALLKIRYYSLVNLIIILSHILLDLDDNIL